MATCMKQLLSWSVINKYLNKCTYFTCIKETINRTNYTEM